VAKQMFPQLKSGGGLLRKLVLVAVLVVVVVLVVQHPDQAADFVKAVWRGAGAVVDSLVTFVHSLGS
jgi:hypothetical protein